MKTKIALAYIRYSHEEVIAVGDDIENLNLAATCMHYTSSGALDPILPAGEGPKYRTLDIEIPEWLLAGIQRGQEDGRWWNKSAEVMAARVVMGHHYSQGWDNALEPLLHRNGKFYDSLREYFATHGYLTDKQAATACRRKWNR